MHYDTVNRKVHAHRYLHSNDGSGGRFELLWVCRYRNTVQMMLYVDTGELVLEDAPHAISLSSNPLYKDAFAVVVDIETVSLCTFFACSMIACAYSALEQVRSHGICLVCFVWRCESPGLSLQHTVT